MEPLDVQQMVMYPTEKSAFIDTNVLAHIVGESSKGLEVLDTLRESKFKVVTFRKCVYELYSMVKGTTKDKSSNKNHPLKKLISKEINDIGQRLFKKEPNIDEIGNSYYWYNLCEEWQGWDFFESSQQNIDKFINKSHTKEALHYLDMQRLFVEWKKGLKSVFTLIDDLLRKHRVSILEYIKVFGSDWYMKKGFIYEQELAKNSLMPNEDFELVLAALCKQSQVFVTEDDKELLWRGGLSLGLGTPCLSFCCPERLKEAIEDNFNLRFYRKPKPKDENHHHG